jgi:class 3 adenylate cyclase
LGVGLVYWSTGDYPTTLEYYQRALSIHQERNDTVGMTNVTGTIGTVYQVIGDYPAAREHYNRALTLYQELGDRLGVARMTGSIGSVDALTGNYTEALEHFRRGLAIHEEIGNRSGVALATGNIVGALLKLHRTDEALLLLEKQDVSEIADPRVIAHNYENRATISEESGDLDAAQEHLEKALSVVAVAGVRVEAGAFHLRLRDLALKQNNLAGYVEHNNEYTRITEEINGKATAQRMAMMEAEKRIAAERAETEKHRALLYNTLPPAIADRVLRGEQVNDAFDSAAVIFMDMVGFTTMSSTMDPNDVVRLLSDIFTACDAIMSEHGLMKIKTIGDSYMAVAFPSEHVHGAAEQQRDIAERAARAALHLLHEFSPEGSPSAPRFRVGIHIGPVTAGVIGTERLQYDVWGDTVNVASRMESNSEPGRIHVSSGFALALKGEEAGKGRKGEKAKRQENGEMAKWQEKDEMAKWRNGEVALTPRGEVEIKGKGAMTTFWLSSPKA